RRPQPFFRAHRQLRFDPYGAGGKKHWIDWRDIINLAVQCDHFNEDDEIGPRQRGVNPLRESVTKCEDSGACDAISSLILDIVRGGGSSFACGVPEQTPESGEPYRG